VLFRTFKTYVYSVMPNMFQSQSASSLLSVKIRSKAVHVVGHVDIYGCETLRIPHFLDSRLTDGSEVVILTYQPYFTSQEDSWYSFLLEAVTPGP
jgi:hypothetical protein